MSIWGVAYDKMKNMVTTARVIEVEFDAGKIDIAV